MDESEKQRYLEKDVWSAKEVWSILLGVSPSLTYPITELLDEPVYDKAYEKITTWTGPYDPVVELENAIDFGYLTRRYSRRIDGSEPDYFFDSREVIKWAKTKRNTYPDFPYHDIASSDTSNGGEWPWGRYETGLLRKLAAAADKFWVGYDTKNPSTAPTSKEVSNWLMRQGIEERTAIAMAKILRADGLPPGRRKEKT